MGVGEGGGEKLLEGSPGNHAAMGLEARLDLQAVDRAMQLRSQVYGETEIDHGGGCSWGAARGFPRAGVGAGQRLRFFRGVAGVSRGDWHGGFLRTAF
jgi:hypothetical protein